MHNGADAGILAAALTPHGGLMFKVSRLVLIVPVLLLGLNVASAKDIDKDELHGKVESIKTDWQAKDDTFEATLKKAYAYAIFPEVGKGGFIIGASHGAGEVYQKGKLIGYTKMTQTTIGAQVGGQTYAEVILFKNKKALDRFKKARFEGSAAATAIGGKKGAAAASKYKDGTAIMVLPLKGAMAEAAGGGQKFAFEPVGE
jgi:lipid-binding SYLF domain-containing protein